MYNQIEKSKNNNQSVANAVAQKKSNNQALEFVDNRNQSIVQNTTQTKENNATVAQLGKKDRDLRIAKANNPNGLQHHNRPEYQKVNEKQMELINGGMGRKEAKRQAKQDIKDAEKK